VSAGDSTAPPSAAARIGRSVLGERLAGFIYGTIVTLSVIVAGARAFPHDPGHVAALVGVTSIVFWLAHVYAHSLGESISHDEHLSVAEVRRIARREGSLIEAAVPPVAALLLGAVGILSERASLWLAFGLGLGVLFVEGIVFARHERLGLVGSVVVIALNLGLGGVLVALKLLLGH
jgi:hypothetical protein